MIKIDGWDKSEELKDWCTVNIGTLIWTNQISDWIGLGWYISRIDSGFKLQIDDERKRLIAALHWT